ncbi:hypothetical protein EST38_g12575 [Candolleomyces aberdarensis]|uniref:Nephrocystin 3-like N-terminal domain-containing protein n=1 Tax=Candolleomyces aberdarensis TaxID=2316362 RepID=A0A4Q2D379_9AGAR|nr:hypothetical protein EST38_g12575 [Candolleomyces aberdarensis]
MAESAPVHVEILSNAHNIQIGELKHTIVNGNQYTFSNDQATFIQLLRPILDASHTRDKETSPPNSACFPGTRTDVIRAIVAWADSTLLWNTHILWLHGYVGCGKSAIALAIALKFERRNRLVGSFFFFQNTGDRSRMARFATTLAFQLAAAIPEAARFIKKAVTEEGLLGLSLVAQLRRLVYEPFKAAAKRVRLLKTFLLKGPFLIVIDGLDECEDRKDVEAFIDDMLDFFKKNPLVPLRFLITSRVEQHIQGRLETDQVRIENLVNHCSRADIDTFMHACFEAEIKRNPVIKAYIRNHGDWPTKKDKDKLIDHIGGSFIFASALFKYIVDPSNNQSTPMDRLPHTLKMNPGLDTLYAKTLSRSQDLLYFSDVISTLALIFEPLPIIGIADLLGIESFEVVRVLVNLQAIIHVPGTDNLPVTMCHTSLRDFLRTESRSGCFFTPPSYHLHLLYRCSTFYDGQRAGTAALYSIRCFAKHLEQFACLPPAAQGPFLRFPQTLDALYAHILAKSEDDPHFSDIISTIALLIQPLSVAVISKLLGIESLQVIQVLVKLKPIINIPETGNCPVSVCHTSFHQFLTTESRSARFFVSPSYYLRLSYYFFSLYLDHILIGAIPWLEFNEWWLRLESHEHWKQCLGANSEPTIHLELDQLAHRPSQPLYQHLFSFMQLFHWVFQDSDHNPQQTSLALTKCINSLALALECAPAPETWLQQPLQELMTDDIVALSFGFAGRLEIHQEQVMTMQHSVQRVEALIRVKDPWNPDVDDIRMFPMLGDWVVMDAYRVLKWIAAHAQARMSSAEPGVTRVLGLYITPNTDSLPIIISIQPYTEPLPLNSVIRS